MRRSEPNRRVANSRTHRSSVLRIPVVVVLIGGRGSGKSTLRLALETEFASSGIAYFSTRSNHLAKQGPKRKVTLKFLLYCLREPGKSCKHLLTHGGSHALTACRPYSLGVGNFKKAYRRLHRGIAQADHFVRAVREGNRVILWEADGRGTWGADELTRDNQRHYDDGTSHLSCMDPLLILRRRGVYVLGVYLSLDDTTSARRVLQRKAKSGADVPPPEPVPTAAQLEHAANLRSWYELIRASIERSGIPVLTLEGDSPVAVNMRIIADQLRSVSADDVG